MLMCLRSSETRLMLTSLYRLISTDFERSALLAFVMRIPVTGGFHSQKSQKCGNYFHVTTLSCAVCEKRFQNMTERQNSETFLGFTGPLCGAFTGPGELSHKGQWRGALMFSLICARINDWVNNREAGDLRCHRGHNGVIVMMLCGI